MSKAFTKENDTDADDQHPADIPPGGEKNYVTPFGLSQLQDEYRELLFNERPKVVSVVNWAAGNGDRSENGDYIYGKKRLREIDRRVRYLAKRIKAAVVVDPQQQKNLTKVYFGATVTYLQSDGVEMTVQIVGVDEADLNKGKISWTSPVAKALLKSQVKDVIEISTPMGVESVTVLLIKY